MKWRLPLALFLLTALGSGQALSAPYLDRKTWRVQDVGTTRIAATFQGAPFIISIHSWPLPINARDPAAAPRYPQCTYSQSPCSAASSTLNAAVVTPMHSASVITAIAA